MAPKTPSGGKNLIAGILGAGTAYPQSDPKNKKKKKHVRGAKPTDKPHTAMAGIDGALFPSNRPTFNMQSGYDGVILLGIPANDFAAAEAALAKKVKLQGLMKSITQDRTPLSAPLLRHPVAPNSNPNAISEAITAPAMTAPAPDAPGPGLSEILEWLKKKNSPTNRFG